jgi:enediyne biosynthesis protein E4
MSFRSAILALGCALAFSALAWAQGDSLSLDTLWRTGQFDAARAMITARQQAGDKSPEFLAQAARAAEEMRDYANAAALWQDYAKLQTESNAGLRKAKQHAWRNLWAAGGENAKAPWLAAAQAEVSEMLRKAGASPSAARQLALELDCILQQVVTGQNKPGTDLRNNYPKSECVLQAAKATLDRISAVSDDKQRQAGIKQFLLDYPGNYWRDAAYLLWLYTAWQAGDQDGLRNAADKYLAEYPSHPDSHGAVSRYYMEADIERKAGLEHAQKSIALYEKQLGTDGSAESLRQLDQQTRSLPVLADWAPATKRQQFTEYLGSRYNLARYLIVQGDYTGALKAVQAVLDCDPFSTEEELTLAPFHVIAGQVAQAGGDFTSAYRHYLAALVLGDSRGRALVLAQSGLNVVAPKVDAKQQAVIAGEFVPQPLYSVSLPVFADVTQAAGLSGISARRVAWGDVDGDGAVDLLLDGSTLLRQDRPGRFSDVSQAWGLARGKLGGVFADLDNDGDLDLYAFSAGDHGDRLYRNEGNHFADVTAVYGGPADSYQSEAAAFVDYDNDGAVDLYVANSPGKDVRTAAGHGPGAADMLYRNSGGPLQLVDPAAAGMTPPFGEALAGRGVSCADFDGNGDQDIFVGNGLAQENLLWRNDGGTFSNAARLMGAAGVKSDAGWGNTNGSDWGDANNDGSLDLFCCNYVKAQHEYDQDKPALLYAQPGAEGVRFSDRASELGIRYASTLMDATWFDCNNDGWLDLYLTAAYDGRRSFLYVNDGLGGFHDLTYLARARLTNAWGCAWADYDTDGDLDLLVASPDGVHLLRNDSPPQGWLEVQCIGAAASKVAPGFSNRAAIGARVSVMAEGLSMVREIQSGKGIGCGNELIAHFGLGQAQGRISIVVRFPSGRTATRALVGGNQRLVFSEGESAAPAAPEPVQPVPPEREQPQPQLDEKGDAIKRPSSGQTR